MTLERESLCERRFVDSWRSRNYHHKRQAFDEAAEAAGLESTDALRAWSRIRSDLRRQWWFYTDGWTVESRGSALAVGSGVRWSTGEQVSVDDITSWRAWLETEWPGRFELSSPTTLDAKVPWRDSIDEALAESSRDPRPILAVTAHAAKSDAEKRVECAMAGEDIRGVLNRIKFVRVLRRDVVPASGIISFRSAEGRALFPFRQSSDDDALAVALKDAAERT